VCNDYTQSTVSLLLDNNDLIYGTDLLYLFK